MFGMSLADICGSIGMALTSLPMPSYMPNEEIYGYRWAGTRLGNTYTCDAQGFFVSFGMSGMFNYNAMLCVYYACAVAFTMRERDIKKYVEPFIHGIPVIGGIVNGFLPILNKMYNPGKYAWCGPIPYPDACTSQEGVECIRGSAKANKDHNDFTSYLIMLFFFIIVSSLVMVVWKVISTQRVMTHISKLYGKRGFEDMQKILKKHANTKAVLIQAVSYIGAFLLSLLPPLLMLIGSGGLPSKTITEFEKLSLVLLPLQGFFNGIIFISHKVYNYRRAHSDTSICHVLSLLLTTSTHDPLFISRISVIKQDELEEEQEEIENNDVDYDMNAPEETKERKLVYEFRIQDESNEECFIQIGGGYDMDNETETMNHFSGDRSRSNEGTIDFLQSSDLTSTNGASDGVGESCGAFSRGRDEESYDFCHDRMSNSSRYTGTSLWNVGSSFEEKSAQEEEPRRKSYYKDL
jgi:hypothetical protein